MLRTGEIVNALGGIQREKKRAQWRNELALATKWITRHNQLRSASRRRLREQRNRERSKRKKCIALLKTQTPSCSGSCCCRRRRRWSVLIFSSQVCMEITTVGVSATWAAIWQQSVESLTYSFTHSLAHSLTKLLDLQFFVFVFYSISQCRQNHKLISLLMCL